MELLAGQVEQQDEAIQTTVKKVAKEYMVQRIQELQMEIAGEGTINQRADLGEEYMVEDSEIGQYQNRSSTVKKRARFLGKQSQEPSEEFETENDYTSAMD